MSFDMGQFTQVFFDEAKEHLATIEEVLLKLNVDAPDLEDLNAIFRAAHSIKGGAGTFGFADMAEFTHVMETLLDRLRKQELGVTVPMVDALLEANDVIRAMLEAHQSGEEASHDQEAEVRARLETFAAGDSAPAPAAAAPAPADPVQRHRLTFQAAADESTESLLGELRALGTLAIVERPDDAADGAWALLIDTAAQVSELQNLFAFVLSPDALTVETLGEPTEPLPTDGGGDAQGYGFFADAEGAPQPDPGFGIFEAAAGAPVADEGFGFFEPIEGATADMEGEGFGFFSDAAGAPGAAVEASTDDSARAGSVRELRAPGSAGRRASDKEGPAAGTGRRAGDKEKSGAGAANGDSSIRVSVEKVDQLINLVGELVITQSMLAQAVARSEGAVSETLINGVAQLERNSRDLQEAVMSIRMMPIAFVFSRFPRLVRDLASKLGKQVDLKLVGEHTELDKGVIEKIADPLTHLVRNSLDHGLENRDEREQSGKPPVGTIALRAFHQGGNIVIEVGDDGRGLNREKILAKARSRGMTVSDDMSDADVFGLIFEAGFSTAEVVTDVSGRGVGMDVVRKNINALGGRVEISSQLGKGCTVSIRLPLTLAILDGMSVAVGKELYILPLGFIVESLQPAATDIKTIAGQGLVMKVRGDYLPVLRLHEAMGVRPNVDEFHKGIMVILEAEGARVAMFVDELVGQHQVVIKSIESNYRKVPGISAATIMGDGKVAMILDVGALVRQATHKSDGLRAA
ncbi:MAG: chemotaxis protein CheW [Burkholderiales bacterium]